MAKQCLVCRKKLGFLSSGYEVARDCVLCYDCNGQLATMRTTVSVDQFAKSKNYLLKDAEMTSHYPEFVELLNRLEESLEKRIQKKKEQERNLLEQKIQRFGGKIPVYEFVAHCGGLGTSYTNTVYVFEDRITISRSGSHAVNNLPGEITIYYKDAVSVSFNDYIRARITFSVPGVSAGVASSAVSVGHGVAVGGSAVDYFSDPCTIMFGLNQGEIARKHYEEIRKHFYASKALTSNDQPSIKAVQQDSAVDKLKKLKELKDMGVLSEDEYEEKRRKLLSEI